MKSILGLASMFVVGALALVHPNYASAATIYACRLNSLGTIRIVSANTPCSIYETKISWNSDGPPGPQGPQGPASRVHRVHRANRGRQGLR